MVSGRLLPINARITGTPFLRERTENICHGGNYINSDWLLRLSPERYRDEVRFHAEMNLRMIRVWGGALVERPEFYNACDEFGILVFQDLWGSGDCNGAWEDPTKMDS